MRVPLSGSNKPYALTRQSREGPTYRHGFSGLQLGRDGTLRILAAGLPPSPALCKQAILVRLRHRFCLFSSSHSIRHDFRFVKEQLCEIPVKPHSRPDLRRYAVSMASAFCSPSFFTAHPTGLASRGDPAFHPDPEEVNSPGSILRSAANGRRTPGDPPKYPYAVSMASAFCSPSFFTASSRILYLRILPAAFMGKASTKSTYRGTLCLAM